MPLVAPTASSSTDADRASVWFWLGIIGIFLVSLALRFWGLERFNTLVFDEVYYAKFASHFLKHESVFTGHPPLSTYIIAWGIWVGEHLPWGDHSVKNSLAGLLLSTFSYRWLNALTGACIPLLVAALAYLLSHRRSLALIAALLVATDGLYLVESRYALNNVYLISFGLWGHIFFLLALRTGRRWLWLTLAGASFAASAAIKWNGLGFLLGAYLVWIVAWVLRGFQVLQPRSPLPPRRTSLLSPLPNLTQIHVGHILVCLALVPAIIYYICWVPYMQLDPNTGFWELQRQTLDYHRRVGGLNAHPYCSLWFTWPLMLRPIAYFYKTASRVTDPVPVVGPPLPQSDGSVIYDVHAMGNPILWWLSTAALLLVIGVLIQQIGHWISRWPSRSANLSANLSANPSANPAIASPALSGQHWVMFYLVLNWLANLLPWLEITRCAFLYHYMESLLFSLLALALILDRWFHSRKPSHRAMGITVIFLIVAAFIFWMPIYLGLPLSPEDIQLRRWLPSWV